MNVFISHSHKDRNFAQKLAAQLKDEGLDVWNPEQELLPGDLWSLTLGKALEKADAMVVLLSPDSVNSPQTLNEIQYALGEKHFRGRLIPVLVRPTKNIPWILEKLPMVKLKPGSQKAAQQIINLLRKKPSLARTGTRGSS
jgi:hypothetical protein